MDENAVNDHYGISGILKSILTALESMGKDLNTLEPRDLESIDEFHTRGKESTIEISKLANIQSHYNVLDVGCGLGGSARYIADQFGCSVTGIDLTSEYVEVAKKLTEYVGLDDSVSFKQGSALELPFPSNSFDVLWTEHTQMNISDKEKFYKELSRVLKPNGRLVFHDIFAGEITKPYFPTPWAENESISSLCTQKMAKASIQNSNLEIEKWIDKSSLSLPFFKAMLQKIEQTGPPPLGLHLLMGKTAKTKLLNQVRNLEENRISVVQGSAIKK